VRSGTTIDHTDGVFAIRGAGQAFTNVTAGRKFVMGGLERLEWRSPSNSSLVDITMTVSAVTFNLATNLPDRGFFDWIVPEMPVGAANLQVNFKSAAGGALGSATNNTGTTAAPTTITLAPHYLPGHGDERQPHAHGELGPDGHAYEPYAERLHGCWGSCERSERGHVHGRLPTRRATRPTRRRPRSRRRFTVGSNLPRLVNISTRMQVLTGNDVMIGGFVIGGGSQQDGRHRRDGSLARGLRDQQPARQPDASAGAVFGPGGACDQRRLADRGERGAADGRGIRAVQCRWRRQSWSPWHPAPTPPSWKESGGGTGVGVVAVYEVDAIATPLVNISTRGRVLTGNDVMIGGFVINGSGPQTVAIVGTGPSLAPFGITNPLANPTLSLVRSSDQAVLASNDNWGAPRTPRRSRRAVSRPATRWSRRSSSRCRRARTR
jgi:hypothetical protein